MINNLAEASFTLLIIVIVLIVFFIFFMKIFDDKLKKKTSKNLKKKVNSQQSSSSFGFWHGHKGLALTFWGFFVGGNILLNASTIIFLDNPTLIIINLIFFVIWNVLAVMGVFNAANIYKAEKMKKGQPYTAANIAKVAVILLILSAIGNNIPR